MKRRAVVAALGALVVSAGVLTTSAGAQSVTTVAAQSVEVRDRGATSCTTDANGYCTVPHTLGVSPDGIQVTPRIPAGYKSYILSVVRDSEDTDSYKLRAVFHDGKPKAKNQIWFYADLHGTKVITDPDPDPEPDPDPGPAPSPGTCTNPTEVWPTYDGGGPLDGSGFGDGKDYYGMPNLWNDNGTVTMSMGVCSFHSWYVDVTAKNLGDGAVLSYPNTHKDWYDWGTGKMPALSSFTTIPTKFAASNPGNIGEWNASYDAWFNGIASAGATELMIWNRWTDRSMDGFANKIDTVTIDGKTWDVYAATYDWHFVAFLAQQQFDSGSLDIKHFTDWLQAKHAKYLAADSTIGAIDYGIEIVSTGGQKIRFDVTDFQVDAY